MRGNVQIVYGGNNWFTRIEGVTRDYFTVRNYEVNQGAAFVDADDQLARKVALIGQTVVDQLFAGMDPVGSTIRINNVPLTVVGTLKPKGQSPSGEDQDDMILVPLSTAKRKLLGRQLGQCAKVCGTFMSRLVRRRLRRRPNSRSANCCASATSCGPTRTTISRFAI